jgi:Spy/CpxP family protein refolding chaperone
MLAPVLAPVLAFVLAAGGHVHAQPPSPFVPGSWWRDFQKTLGLSEDQSSRIDGVFQAALPHLRHKRDELEAQEKELSRLIQTDADEAAIGRQSDRVEAVRAVLNKTRTLMLVHMRSILSPDQRNKLNLLREQWDRDHPQPPRSGTSNTPK